MKIPVIFIGFLLLSGCGSAPKQFMVSEEQDDYTCRSYVKNKSKSDPGTYAECRKSLVDVANNPPVFAVPPVQSAGGGGYYPAPSSDAAFLPPPGPMTPLPNILPPTVRCQTMNVGSGMAQTVCR